MQQPSATEQLGRLRVATVSKDLPAPWQAHQTDHPENPFEGPEIYEGQGEVGATSFVHSPPQPHSPAAPQTQASSQTPGQLGVARVNPVRGDDDEDGVIYYPLAQATGESGNNQGKQSGPRAVTAGENPNLARSSLHVQAKALCAPPAVIEACHQRCSS